MTQLVNARPRGLFDVIPARASVRAFRRDPVDRDLVVKSIEAAGWAPSPHGTQPWRFAILEREVDRRSLAEVMAISWREQLRFDDISPDEIERRLGRSRDRLERAPIVVILCLYLDDAHEYPDASRQWAEEVMAIQSLGAAAQNFLLALHANGLDSGWMCAPLFCPDVIRDHLGLDGSLKPHAMFPVGHMAAPPKRRPRRPVKELIVPIRNRQESAQSQDRRLD